MKFRYLLALLALFICASTATGAVITVHSGESIQSAIDSAHAGDTIEIGSGTYYEHLTIEKPLTLEGVDTGGGKPVIDGQGGDTIIQVRSDCVVIESLEVTRCDTTREGGKRGIHILGNHCTVEDCEISECNIGISCYSECSNTIVKNCVFIDNRIGLVFGGKNHIADGNHFKKAHMILDSAIECYIVNNLMEDDVVGISVYDESNNNYIAGNTIKGNRYAGIWVIESEWGPTSHGNRIFHNNFINNGRTYQAVDDSDNSWDNGAEGNYWSDFSGADVNGDGIYDQPYTRIAGDDYGTTLSLSNDNHPLVSQWQGTETAPDFSNYCSAGNNPNYGKPTEVVVTYTELPLAGPPDPSSPQGTLEIVDIEFRDTGTIYNVYTDAQMGHIQLSEYVREGLKSEETRVVAEGIPFEIVVGAKAVGGDITEPMYVVLTPPNEHTGLYCIERIEEPSTLRNEETGTWRFRVVCLDALVDMAAFDQVEISHFATLCKVPDIFTLGAWGFTHSQTDISEMRSAPVLSIRKTTDLEKTIDETIGNILEEWTYGLYALLEIEGDTINALELLSDAQDLIVKDPKDILGDSTDRTYGRTTLIEAYEKESPVTIPSGKGTPGFGFLLGLIACMLLILRKR
jgi:parallel beta-helix repeat protein